jgi:hypothetical protein
MQAAGNARAVCNGKGGYLQRFSSSYDRVPVSNPDGPDAPTRERFHFLAVRNSRTE